MSENRDLFESSSYLDPQLDLLKQEIPNMVRFGVHISYKTSERFYGELSGYITDSKFRGVLDPVAIVCPSGVDRSNQMKLLAYDSYFPVALTADDIQKIYAHTERREYPQIGMQYDQLAKRIREGTVNNNRLHPNGFPVTIHTILGYISGLAHYPLLNILDENIRLVTEKNHVKSLDLQLVLLNDFLGSSLIDRLRQEKKIVPRR